MQLHLDIVTERVHAEINERSLQGYDVGNALAEWESARGDRAALMALHDRLKALPMQAGWPYREPSGLEEIRAERPVAPPLGPFYLSELEVRGKIHGAWLGRAAGCVLGKPLEMGFSPDEIRAYLEGADAYPLADFVPAQSRASTRPLRRDCSASMKGYVAYAQEDDDLNYMCLAVNLLEQKGPGFTTLDVGLNWLSSIPFFWTWGPEHVVYLNLATAVGGHPYDLPGEIDLEEVTGTLNPGVEWIGAQIRTDVYGYVCPGRPALAAELAWRDAYVTHRKSGIYGAMWVAAMNAAAFTLLDMESIILQGLAQAPERSRFAEAILRTIEWCRQDDDWTATGRRIIAHFDKYGFAGTINNAACVAAALLHGWKGADSAADAYERAITIAVQLGYDTDCNGATVGSVAGLVLGASALPAKWTAPLNDTLRTCVAGFGQESIAEMARRTYELSRIVGASGNL